MKKFKVLDKVKNSLTNECGIIIYCYDKSDDVAVEYVNGYIQKTNSLELIHYSNELEQAFATLQSKVDTAAILMADINKMAKTFQIHLSALAQNDYVDTKALLSELMKTGWVSSSMDC